MVGQAPGGVEEVRRQEQGEGAPVGANGQEEAGKVWGRGSTWGAEEMATMGLWRDAVPGNAGTTNWGHMPGEEGQGTADSAGALGPRRVSRLGPVPALLGHGGLVLGQSCVKVLCYCLAQHQC